MNNDLTPLVEVRDLVKHFKLRGSWLKREKPVIHAVDGVSLEIYPGEVLGLVGESGCGKTTLGRCILRLVEPTSGAINFDGQNITHLPEEALRTLRPKMQVVSQNPLASLSPRMRIRTIMDEPLRMIRMPENQRLEFIVGMLEQVGLGVHHLDRFPHEISGGQCQRVAIARALSTNPRMLVLDEPTSALDVSVQAQILNLLRELKQQHLLTYLFVSHDLGVVEYLSDRVGIMYLGHLVEVGPVDSIFKNPRHPYTQALLAAVPSLVPGAIDDTNVLEGNIPSPIDPPSGCRFHTRCPFAEEGCKHEKPELHEIESGHAAACHLLT